MQIFIEIFGGETMTLEVNALDTISDLKNEIHAKKGIAPALQILFFAGKKLENDCTLADFNVTQQSSLNLVRLYSMKIFVISFTGKSIRLEVKASDTIAKVKGEIEEKLGIPLCWQSLFYDSTRLEDDDMLFQRNVKENAKFDMVLEVNANTHARGDKNT